MHFSSISGENQYLDPLEDGKSMELVRKKYTLVEFSSRMNRLWIFLCCIPLYNEELDAMALLSAEGADPEGARDAAGAAGMCCLADGDTMAAARAAAAAAERGEGRAAGGRGW